MIRFIYCCIAHSCYFIGDTICKLAYFEKAPEWFFNLWMPPYNYFMLKSLDIDQKYNFGIWEEFDEDLN